MRLRHGQCGRCSYPLSGTEIVSDAATCPECGFANTINPVANSAARITAAQRRSWIFRVIGIVLLGGLLAGVIASM